MNRKIFAERLAELLDKFGLPRPADLQQESCTLSFEQQPDLHIINYVADFIDVVCHSASLPQDVAPETLTGLLALNGFERDEPAVMVSVHPPSGTVSLLGRYALHEMNLARLTHVVEAIYRKHGMVSELLAGQAEASR